MQYREMDEFTGKALQGKYPQAYAAALLYPSVMLLMKLFPCFLAAVLIACGRISPRALFFGKNYLWIIFSLLWGILRLCILTPVGCGMCSWFTRLYGLETKFSETVFFRDARSFCRGVLYFAAVAFQRYLVLFPFVLSLCGAAACFRCSTLVADAGVWLFAALQCILAAFWSGLYYLHFCIGLAAVPFLYLSHPGSSPFRAVRESRRMMEGRCLAFVRLLLRYLPAALPVFTIPLLLPRLMGNCTLFLQISIREWEQCQGIEENDMQEESRPMTHSLKGRGMDKGGKASLPPTSGA